MEDISYSYCIFSSIIYLPNFNVDVTCRKHIVYNNMLSKYMFIYVSKLLFPIRKNYVAKDRFSKKLVSLECSFLNFLLISHSLPPMVQSSVYCNPFAFILLALRAAMRLIVHIHTYLYTFGLVSFVSAAGTYSRNTNEKIQTKIQYNTETFLVF